MRKYGNVKVDIDGYKFDSKMEADYYYYLKIAKEKGEVKEFVVHPKYMLQPSFRFKNKAISAITYTADFEVTYSDDSFHIVDVKGVKTNEFKIKEKMLKYMYRNHDVDIYCLTLHKETWIKL